MQLAPLSAVRMLIEYTVTQWYSIHVSQASISFSAASAAFSLSSVRPFLQPHLSAPCLPVSFRRLTHYYRVGMAEYVMCFAAVAGVLVLRVRSRSIEPGPGPPIYRTFILNPVLYCVLSVFVVARSAVKHPVQGLVIFVFNGIGVAVYKSRWWQRFVRIGKDLS
jgi:hypothetical protein